MSILIIKKERFKSSNKNEHTNVDTLLNYPTSKVINLTGHTVNDAMGEMIYPAEKMMVARFSINFKYTILPFHVKMIYEFQYTSISGLPDPRIGVKYIVSAPVLNAALSIGRSDCIAVNDVIRDRNGHVMGCKGFRLNGWKQYTSLMFKSLETNVIGLAEDYDYKIT